MRKLYDIAYPNKSAGDFWNAGQTNFGVFSDATSAAAFQVAVWNIYFDSDLSLSGGSFQWTGGATAVSTAAQSLLNQVASYGSGDGYANWTLYRFVSPPPDSQQRTGYQNLHLGYVPGPGARHAGHAGIRLGRFGGGSTASALLARRTSSRGPLTRAPCLSGEPLTEALYPACVSQRAIEMRRG